MEISQVRLTLSWRYYPLGVPSRMLIIVLPTQHAKYTCTYCGKDAVRRTAVGIWHCKGCRKTTAGGAWTVSTPAATAVRR